VLVCALVRGWVGVHVNDVLLGGVWRGRYVDVGVSVCVGVCGVCGGGVSTVGLVQMCVYNPLH